MSKRRLVSALAVLYALYFVVYVHRTITGVLKPEFEHVSLQYGIDVALLSSTMASAYFYAYSSMQLPGGVLADALGVKRYTAISGGIMTLGALLFSTTNPQLMIIGRILIGAGAAAIYISIQRVIGVYADKNSGGTLTGLALSIGNLGALFATMPARSLIDSFGLPAFFLGLTAVTAFLSISPLFSIEDEGVSTRGVMDGLKKAIGQLKVVARSYHSIAVALAYTGTYSAILAFQSYWGYEYMQTYFHLTKSEAAQALFLLALAFLLSVPLVGFISDTVLRKRKPILIVGCLLHSLAWFTAALLPLIAPSKSTLYAFTFLLGLIASTHMVISPMSREAYPPEFSGTTFAFVNLVGFLAVAVYQSLGIFIGDPLIILKIFGISALITGIMAIKTRETL
ncbi:MAG: MFS transporter [Infirmifilum sp.]